MVCCTRMACMGIDFRTLFLEKDDVSGKIVGGKFCIWGCGIAAGFQSAFITISLGLRELKVK